jgi:hypothetical protein
MNEPREITKWITQHQWDFFITITFDKRYSDTHILNIMEDIENHYLIQQICWFREFTTTGLPHIHMVVKSNKLTKSIKTLPKHLKKWGQIDFQLFRNKTMNEGIDYISKLWGKDNDLIWNVKLPKGKQYERQL